MRRLVSGYERDPVRRQDLVQDIRLALWKALPRSAAHVRSGLRVPHRAQPRRKSHPALAPPRHRAAAEDVGISDGGIDPERAASQRQRQQRLQTAVRRLPLGRRQVVVLTLEGSVMPRWRGAGISVNNVAVRFTRARTAGPVARRRGSETMSGNPKSIADSDARLAGAGDACGAGPSDS